MPATSESERRQLDPSIIQTLNSSLHLMRSDYPHGGMQRMMWLTFSSIEWLGLDLQGELIVPENARIAPIMRAVSDNTKLSAELPGGIIVNALVEGLNSISNHNNFYRRAAEHRHQVGYPVDQMLLDHYKIRMALCERYQEQLYKAATYPFRGEYKNIEEPGSYQFAPEPSEDLIRFFAQLRHDGQIREDSHHPQGTKRHERDDWRLAKVELQNLMII